jgi:chromosome transmission fidelity protein 8
MPSTLIHPPTQRAGPAKDLADVLPSTLQTPSGLALIELQGKILVDDADGLDEDLQSALTVGRLIFPAANDITDSHSLAEWDGRRVFLFVGKHQRLAGEVKKLAKPIAVMRRRGSIVTGPTSNDHEMGGTAQNPASSQDLEIVEIITQKILFANRPEPIGVEQEQDETVPASV